MKSRPIGVAGLTGLVVVSTATAVLAAGPPYTVAVGGSSAPGTHPFTASSTGTVALSAKNSAGTVVNFNCTSVNASGIITSGTGVNPVASGVSTTWQGCKMPGGNLSVAQSGTWNITGTGADATTGTEKIAGYVGDVSARMSLAASPATCSFTVGGRMAATFDESTQRLVVAETGYSGRLVLSNVAPCLGLLQDGNVMNVAFTMNVTSPDGAIDVS